MNHAIAWFTLPYILMVARRIIHQHLKTRKQLSDIKKKISSDVYQVTDVSGIILLRKRLGRAAISIIVLVLFSSMWVSSKLSENNLPPLICLAIAVLVFYFVYKTSKQLRSGKAYATFLVGIIGVLYLSWLLYYLFPGWLKNGENDIYSNIFMGAIFFLPFYFVIRGLQQM